MKKNIAKAALTIILFAAVILTLSEASTASLQLLTSGAGLLTIIASYKGLERLGTFETINK